MDKLTKKEAKSLDFLQKAYELIKKGDNNFPRYKLEKICRVSGAFAKVTVDNGVLKNDGTTRSPKWSWESDVPPNIKLVRQLIKDEDKYWRSTKSHKNTLKPKVEMEKKDAPVNVVTNITTMYKQIQNQIVDAHKRVDNTQKEFDDKINSVMKHVIRESKRDDSPFQWRKDGIIKATAKLLWNW